MRQIFDNGLQFAKQLANIVTAFSLMGLGAYAVYTGRAKITLALGAVALIFSGVLAAVVSLGLLYKTLMGGDGSKSYSRGKQNG